MRTAIIYISKHGTTEKLAHTIAAHLTNTEVDLINLKHHQLKSIDKYDQIILGCSIHMGVTHKKTTNFCKKHLNILLTKQLGIFVCCMEKSKIAQDQIAKSLPEKILKHAKFIVLPGYEFLVDKMNFFEKILVKKTIGATDNISKINKAEIDFIVQNMQE